MEAGHASDESKDKDGAATGVGRARAGRGSVNHAGGAGAGARGAIPDGWGGKGVMGTGMEREEEEQAVEGGRKEPDAKGVVGTKGVGAGAGGEETGRRVWVRLNIS